MYVEIHLTVLLATPLFNSLGAQPNIQSQKIHYEPHLPLVIYKVTRQESQLASWAASSVLLGDPLQQAPQLLSCKETMLISGHGSHPG